MEEWNGSLQSSRQTGFVLASRPIYRRRAYPPLLEASGRRMHAAEPCTPPYADDSRGPAARHRRPLPELTLAEADALKQLAGQFRVNCLQPDLALKIGTRIDDPTMP